MCFASMKSFDKSSMVLLVLFLRRLPICHSTSVSVSTWLTTSTILSSRLMALSSCSFARRSWELSWNRPSLSLSESRAKNGFFYLSAACWRLWRISVRSSNSLRSRRSPASLLSVVLLQYLMMARATSIDRVKMWWIGVLVQS